jgi:hypothetical protein
MTMEMSRTLLILLLAIGVVGCVSAQTTMLTPSRYAPVPASEVHVYLSDDEVPPGCERIALIHAAGDVNLTNEQQMITAARKRAGRAGANAVVIRSMRDPGLATVVAAEILDLRADRKGEMIGYRCPHPVESN